MKTLIDWYKLYPNAHLFLLHRILYIGEGVFFGVSAKYLGFPITGMIILFLYSVYKEILEHHELFYSTKINYKYKATFISHMLDIILSMVGGLIGLISI